MKKMNKMPRILKIKSVKGFEIYCIFNNGETRVIDFKELFKKWKVNKKDPEYLLLDQKEFKKVNLRNQTLSWKNVKIQMNDINGQPVVHPFELSPDLLYKNSHPSKDRSYILVFGST